MSTSIRSGSSFRAVSRAAAPSCATSTSWPASSSSIRSPSAASALSSTTSTRARTAGASAAACASTSSADEAGRAGRHHDELRALPQAVAPHLDAAAVELDEAPHDREPDAEAPLGPVERPLGLREGLEDARDHLGRDADPAVAHVQHRLLADALGAHLDPPARLRVLDRVGQQVDQHLLEPRGVDVDPDVRGGPRHDQRVATLLGDPHHRSRPPAPPRRSRGHARGGARCGPA